jgi:hypothetical protein
MVKPVSMKPNNQDALVWSLYLLGGASRPVEVEDVFLKCFELAPARLGWRNHPNIPDYKKVSKALQSVEATTHVGLIVKIDKYHRQLTAAGIQWIEENQAALKRIYSGELPVAASNHSPHERLRRRIFDSGLAENYPLTIMEIATLLECSATSPKTVWMARLASLDRAVEALGDPKLLDVSRRIKEALRGEGIIQ